MAKGSVAKDKVIKKLQEVYGKNFQGIDNKKVYILEEEAGELIQVAIALTCPKNPVQFGSSESTLSAHTDDESTDYGNVVSFDGEDEITTKELETVEDLIKKLNL